MLLESRLSCRKFWTENYDPFVLASTSRLPPRCLAGTVRLPRASEEGNRVVPKGSAVLAGDREQLTKLHRSGVCELRWIDEAGRRHFEPQVDCDLWWQPPSAFAMQFSKLGEILGWVGGDGNQLWLFDLLSEPTQLTIIEPEAAAETVVFGLPLAGLLDGWQLQPLSAVGPRSPELVQSRLGPVTLFATGVGLPPNRLATDDGRLEVLYSSWNMIARAQDDANGRSAGQWFLRAC